MFEGMIRTQNLGKILRFVVGLVNFCVNSFCRGSSSQGGGLVCYQVELLAGDGQDMHRLVKFYVTSVYMFVGEVDSPV